MELYLKKEHSRHEKTNLGVFRRSSWKNNIILGYLGVFRRKKFF